MGRIKLLLAVAMAAMIALQAAPAFAQDWNNGYLGPNWNNGYLDPNYAGPNSSGCLGLIDRYGRCLGLNTGSTYGSNSYGPGGFYGPGGCRLDPNNYTTYDAWQNACQDAYDARYDALQDASDNWQDALDNFYYGP